MPILVALWIGRVAHLSHDAHWQFPLAVAAASAVVVLLVGYRAQRAIGRAGSARPPTSSRWRFAFVLAAAAIFDIERDAAAVMLELICVAALVLIARWNDDRVRVGHWIIPATVIGVALVLQANLLRWLGPPGDLNALDVARMNWPTLVSLLWASIGAALTIWARRVGSRVQWSAGAAFLVGAAIKLLLLDFGSLGQLANILAVIAAGGVFLLVGWLAPMPPAAAKPPAPRTGARIADRVVPAGARLRKRFEREAPRNRLAWTVAIAAWRVVHGFALPAQRYLSNRIEWLVCGRSGSAESVAAAACGGRCGFVRRGGGNRCTAAQSRDDDCTRWASRLPSAIRRARGDRRRHLPDVRRPADSRRRTGQRTSCWSWRRISCVTWDIRWTEDSTLRRHLADQSRIPGREAAWPTSYQSLRLHDERWTCARTRRRSAGSTQFIDGIARVTRQGAARRSPTGRRCREIPTWRHESMMRRVLFVCLGNICRSPTAEGVLRAIAAREFPGVKLEIDSAGTADYHVGEPPDRRTVAAARRRGYDLAGLRARQVQRDDFHAFDFVLAMDRANLAELESRRPRRRHGASRAVPGVRAASSEFEEVPDPYYGGIEDFERVLDLCEAAARGLLARLAAAEAQRKGPHACTCGPFRVDLQY